MNGMNNPVLSIVTPSYNRGHLLRNCLDSLERQSNKDFEWIIVDDGSADNTEEVVASFSASAFPIHYVKKENGGKHTALNASMAHITGKYVLVLDSDDTLTENAVDEICDKWKQYENDQSIGILTFLRGYDASSPLCVVSDFDTPVDIMRYKRTVITSTDCCEVIRSELFCKYPFPVFDGERFISECAMWNRVSMTHKCVYIDKVIYICEYLEDGLTKAGRKLRICNPNGGMFISNLRMNARNYLSQRMKYALLYVTYGYFAGFSPKQIIQRDCDNLLLKVVFLIPGFGLYQYWKHKYLQ